jgi:hypothetical protein
LETLILGRTTKLKKLNRQEVDGVMKIFSTFFFIVGSFCSAASAQGFTVDLTPEEVDEIRGTVRASDLAVNDIAYFYPGRLCERGGDLFLPSDATMVTAGDTSSFIIKFTMQPSKSLLGELVPPTKSEEFDESDVINLIESLAEVGGLFSPTFCDEIQRISKRNLDFYPIISIDGHTELRGLSDDLISRSFIFGK